MNNPVCCQSRLGNILHQNQGGSGFAVALSTANAASCHTGVRGMRTERRFKISKAHLQMAKGSTWLIPLKTVFDYNICDIFGETGLVSLCTEKYRKADHRCIAQQ